MIAIPCSTHAPERGRTPAWRVVAALASSALLLALVATTFWYQDWRYSLPTPPPPGLEQVALGALVADLPLAHEDGRPLFLHFTSRACPCSRFALDHVRALVREHGERVRFVAVLPAESEDGSVDATDEREGTGLGIPEVVDVGGRLAARLGVYSTPQAVLLDADGTLRYRGNYNAARFCTRRESEYARLALEALLAGAPIPAWPEAATRAYGCALPTSVARGPE